MAVGASIPGLPYYRRIRTGKARETSGFLGERRGPFDERWENAA
jgi:hypothetical protein